MVLKLSSCSYVKILLVLSFIGMAISCSMGVEPTEQIPIDKINSPWNELSISADKYQEEIYFERAEGKWGKDKLRSKIFFFDIKNDSVSDIKIPSFGSSFNEGDICLSYDGNQLFYTSDRPIQSDSSVNIWTVSRKNKDAPWETPIPMGNHINSPETEYSPFITKNGNLYFSSTNTGGYGQGDLYYCTKTKSGFSNPMNLGPIINSSFGEWNLTLNQDEDILLFEASQRKTNKTAYGDLYISFRKNNLWTIPQNIEEINSNGSDLNPTIFDNNTLVYSSNFDSQQDNVDFVKVDFEAIRKTYLSKAKLPYAYLLAVNRSEHTLAIIDIVTGEKVKSIDLGYGPHEISISKRGNVAYIPSYGSFPKPHKGPILSQGLVWEDSIQNSVYRIDLISLQTKRIELSEMNSPHGIYTDMNGEIFWVTDEKNGKVIEVDGNTGKILNRYSTAIGSHIILGNANSSKLYVSNIESNSISIIDTKNAQIKNIVTEKSPEGILLNQDDSELWILCHGSNKIQVMDVATEKIVKSFPSAGRFPIKATSIGDEIWVTNVIDKSVSIYNSVTKSLKSTLALNSTPLGITSYGNNVFVTLPRWNQIVIIDARTKQIINTMSSGIEPDGITVLQMIDNFMTF